MEPVESLNEIFGEFPITCVKCFKELQKNEIILHCESDDFNSMVWVTPMHLQCGKALCIELNVTLVPFRDLIKFNKDFFVLGLEKMR